MNEISIGLLIPAPNVTMEKELPRFAPDGVHLHWNRVPKSSLTVTPESVAEMGEHVVEAARPLAMAGVRLLTYACTSGSFILGQGWDEELNKRMTEATGLPAVTTSTAMLKALKALGARKIGLATPYIDEITSREVAFLEANGFEVGAAKGLRIVESGKIPRVSQAEVRGLAYDVVRANADGDALFISCTNLPTMDFLDELEGELKIPVLSSNQVTLWWSLRLAGWDQPLERGGRLLKEGKYWMVDEINR